MKLITPLLTAFCMLFTAALHSQNITLSVKNVSLQEALNAIERQTDYRFVYVKEQIEKAGLVTIDVKQVQLETALLQCFEGQPLSYVIEDRLVIVRKKEQTKDQPVLHDVKGRVTSKEGTPLPGITVRVKGKNIATATGENGAFSLTGISPSDILIFSGAEVETRELPVNGNYIVTIALSQKVQGLDETLIIGYGTTTRRFSVGSVTKVSSEDIAIQPVSNPLAALQGRVPGLVISATSGVPGSTFLVQVRGQNSLNPNPSLNASIPPLDNPLVIIDGVPFSPPINGINQYQSLASPGNSGQYQNEYAGLTPYNSINPYDIESVEVLRDASETAIYGSRGANGVILITTKKGTAGKSNLNINLQTGVSHVGHSMKLMDTKQYRSLREEAISNDGLIPNLFPGAPGYAPDLLVYDSSRFVDWEKYFTGKIAKTSDANLSLTGGSAQTEYRIGAGYHEETYVYPGSFRYQRISFNNSLSHRSLNQKFRIDFSFNYAFDRNTSSGTPDLLKAFTLPPNYPGLLDQEGKPTWYYNDAYLFTNPAAYIKQSYNTKNYNLITHVQAGYELTPGLQLQTSIGYNTFEGNEISLLPASTQHPVLFPISYTNFGTSNYSTLIVEPQLNYTLKGMKGELLVLVGGTYQQNTTKLLALQASGFANESLMHSVGAARNIISSDQYSQYKYSGSFARLNYIYNHRYIIQFSGRRDGSSRFGPGKQFGNFGSVGSGWIFSEEKIFRNLIPWFSYGKIRGSYGSTGSDNIGNYEYLSRWSASTSPGIPGIDTYVPENHYNPNFSWSITRKLETAIEIGLFNDRLLLNVAWFRNRCGNQLVTYQLPAQTGFTGVTANFPALVENTGWEVTLTSTNIKRRDFIWRTNFNMTLPKNKLLKFPKIESTSYNFIYKVGHSLTTLNKYVFIGVNPSTGIYEYASKNGDTYNPNPNSDYTIIGNLDPIFYGGIQNLITWKNLSLVIQFDFKKQFGPNYLQQIYQNYPPGTFGNLPVEFLDRWQKPGDRSNLQKLTSFESGSDPAVRADQNFVMSSGAYEDASFIRLRTLALSYRLPSKWMAKIKGMSCKLFLNGQNVLTITSYRGHDPETMSYFSLPPLRTIVSGLQLNF